MGVRGENGWNLIGLRRFGFGGGLIGEALTGLDPARGLNELLDLRVLPLLGGACAVSVCKPVCPTAKGLVTTSRVLGGGRRVLEDGS
jgi:hypothetical protein